MSTICLWPLDVGCCQAVWDAADTAARTRAQEYATLVLNAFTGRRFGPCPITVRPCHPCTEASWQTYGVWYDAGSDGGYTYLPFVWNGTWRNCGCQFGCCCGLGAAQVWLPGPVHAITEVRVDNALVPASSYRVDNREWLVRTDGEIWPQFQSLANPATSIDNTFVVAYLRGEAVPDGGQAAAGMLACEYLKACADQPCRLPKRVTSVSRQGVSISAQETVQGKLTGIHEVDQWITAVNPHGLRQAPRAYSPDVPTPRVTTWSSP